MASWTAVMIALGASWETHPVTQPACHRWNVTDRLPSKCPATLPSVLPGFSLAACTLVLLAAGGCSPKKTAIRYAADALSQSGSSTVWSGDDDPQLVGDAMPFALKTMESLLASQPDHVGLHTSLASGFTQYAYAFVHQQADFAEDESLAKAQAGWERARKLYDRARLYALRGLDLQHPGFSQAFRKDARAAVKQLEVEDMELAYWAGAALGAEITLSKDQPDLIAELPAVGLLMEHLLALDEDFSDGAVHEFMISYEAARPASMGGSVEKARKHFDRVLELTGGHKASPFVSWAETVAVAQQDRKLFDEMLRRALAVDVNAVPRYRLANVIAQRRAAWLLRRADELILVSEEPMEKS